MILTYKVLETSVMNHAYNNKLGVTNNLEHTYPVLQSNLRINFNNNRQKRTISKIIQGIDTQNKQKCNPEVINLFDENKSILDENLKHKFAPLLSEACS